MSETKFIKRTKEANRVYDAEWKDCECRAPDANGIDEKGFCHHLDKESDGCCSGGCPRIILKAEWGNPARDMSKGF